MIEKESQVTAKPNFSITQPATVCLHLSLGEVTGANKQMKQNKVLFQIRLDALVVLMQLNENIWEQKRRRLEDWKLHAIQLVYKEVDRVVTVATFVPSQLALLTTKSCLGNSFVNSHRLLEIPSIDLLKANPSPTGSSLHGSL